MVHYSISTFRPSRCNLFCSFFLCLNTQCKQSQQKKVLKIFCVCPVCVCVSARRKHIPFQDPLSATLIHLNASPGPLSSFGPRALNSQITPKWEWRRVKFSHCKYLTSAPPPFNSWIRPCLYMHAAHQHTNSTPPFRKVWLRAW